MGNNYKKKKKKKKTHNKNKKKTLMKLESYPSALGGLNSTSLCHIDWDVQHINYDQMEYYSFD